MREEEIALLSGERVDDLLVNGLRMIQRDGSFCFGTDAVELANFVTGGKKDKAVDLGSGSGIISLLLAGKKGISVDAVEIQPEMADRCRRNALLNGLQDKITVRNLPMQRLGEVIEKGSRTVVVCNPPYRKVGSGAQAQEETESFSRYEIAVTLKEVVDTAAYLLSTGGRFYLVHICERMAEALAACSNAGLEPKLLQVLTPKAGKKPHIFMLKCIKDGASGLDVLPERPVQSFC